MRKLLTLAGTTLVVGVLLGWLAMPSPGQPTPSAGKPADADLAKKVVELVDRDEERLVGIFKDIHQNPELGFMEVRTAGIVAKELKTLGFEVTTGIGQTGVVGIFKNGDGPVVMYRADMDANAVRERTGLPYASKATAERDGGFVPVAHMCGHDAHVTWMLGVAKAMVELNGEWGGTLVMVGQPAEELITGAKAMVDDGLYTKHQVPKPDYLFGLHTVPGPVGLVVCAGGTLMAGSDQLDVTFHGVGGHGSTPQFAKDPVVMSAAAVMQYQTIVSRTITPQETAVLTVGSVQAGNDNNVIPETALVKINLRYFKPEVREQMLKSIKTINDGIAKASGMPDDKLPTVVMKGGCTPLVNDDALAKRLQKPLKGLLGEKNVVTEFAPATGSEDFHLLLGEHKAPYLYLAVGVADPDVFAQARKQSKQLPYASHNPNFIVDLKAIPVGAKVGATTLLEVLAKKPAK